MLDAINRRGQPICCRITLSPLLGTLNESSGSELERRKGVILLIEEERR